jgi:hypothetical protein
MRLHVTFLALIPTLVILGGCAKNAALENAYPAYQPSDNQAVYTFSGQKDATLIAQFVVTYVATKKEAQCVRKQGDTAIPLVKEEKFAIKHEHYTQSVRINLTPPKDNPCAYEFKNLDLLVRPSNAPTTYNRFPLLGRYPSPAKERSGHWAHPIYNGSKEGSGTLLTSWTQKYAIPYAYRSDAKYFKIADETNVSCRTFAHSGAKYPYFLCLMDIEDPAYRFKSCSAQDLQLGEECGTLSHPDFALKALKDMSFTLNILSEKKAQ